jgi:hypothetical protein
MRLVKLWGLISDFGKKSSMINFHWNLIKKIKGKMQWDFDPKVCLENDLSDIVHVYLENEYF